MRKSFYDLAFQYLTDELAIRPKSAAIFLSLFGLKGAEHKTLQQTAKEFDRTRERVRQIREAIFKQLEKQGKLFKADKVDQLFSELKQLPASNTQCLALLDDDIESIAPIFEFIEHFGDGSNTFHCIGPSKHDAFAEPILVLEGDLDAAMAIKAHMAKTFSHNAKKKTLTVIPVDCLLSWSGVDAGTGLGICKAFYGGYILDEGVSPYHLPPENLSGRHIVLPTRDKKILSIIEKQSAIATGVDINVLAASAHRHSRSKVERQLSPSVASLKILLRDFYGVDIEGDWVSFTGLTPYSKQHLPKSEQTLLQHIMPGEALDYATLYKRLEKTGMRRPTIDVCIFRSPLLVANSGLYSLLPDGK